MNIKKLEQLSKDELISLLVDRAKLSGTTDTVEKLSAWLITNKSVKGIDFSRENFGVICLASDNSVLDISILATGTVDKSTVHLREVAKHMLGIDRTKSIILFHNHPSGNLSVSKSDLIITKRIQDLCSMLEVRMLDHLIINDFAIETTSMLELELI